MHFIEHIIEPTKLLLAWQSPDENYRFRHIIGELRQKNNEISLQYLPETKDFVNAQKHGFEAYPAFPEITKTYTNVVDAFMRRLPPRSRGDFPQYLEGLRLKPNVVMSDFALLGYSGAKLLSDGFSIIHPFDNVEGPCELLLEAAGYRHIKVNSEIQVGTKADFTITTFDQESAIDIEINGTRVGSVNRGLLPAFLDWIHQNRIIEACVEKKNGIPEKPTLYLFVKIAAK